MTANEDMKPMTEEELGELAVKIRTFLGIDPDAGPREILDDLIARLMNEKSNLERRRDIYIVKCMQLEDEVKYLRKKNKLRKQRKKAKKQLKETMKDVMDVKDTTN